jgi:hypothetical protein
MMHQMGGGPQGMFPMMNPALWNLPMGQWQQFMSQMNPMGNFPQGQYNHGAQGASVSQSSGVGLPAPTQAQPAPAAKSKKKVQSVNSDGSKKNDKAMVPSSGPMLDQKFKDIWITVQLGMLLCPLQNTGGVQIKGWVSSMLMLKGLQLYNG